MTEEVDGSHSEIFFVLFNRQSCPQIDHYYTLAQVLSRILVASLSYSLKLPLWGTNLYDWKTKRSEDNALNVETAHVIN